MLGSSPPASWWPLTGGLWLPTPGTAKFRVVVLPAGSSKRYQMRSGVATGGVACETEAKDATAAVPTAQSVMRFISSPCAARDRCVCRDVPGLPGDVLQAPHAQINQKAKMFGRGDPLARTGVETRRLCRSAEGRYSRRAPSLPIMRRT